MGRAGTGQACAAGDVGTTDIQFMLTGSLKEAGLLVLINQHIARRHGDFPWRRLQRAHGAAGPGALLQLARERLPMERCRSGGSGDTVTSTRTADGSGWLRGGSDRGFLTLLQDLGAGAAVPTVWCWSTAAMARWIVRAWPISSARHQ
ncbi:MAG: hypothetical protein CM15mP77_0290 [Synechococcus sp.]|nr:MAG: hypothetical protein CM15mP77_0290 [Synechococcus sp.]